MEAAHPRLIHGHDSGVLLMAGPVTRGLDHPNLPVSPHDLEPQLEWMSACGTHAFSLSTKLLKEMSGV